MSFSCSCSAIFCVPHSEDYSELRTSFSDIDDEPINDFDTIVEDPRPFVDVLPLGCEASYFWPRSHWTTVSSESEEDGEFEEEIPCETSDSEAESDIVSWSATNSEIEDYSASELERLQSMDWQSVDEVDQLGDCVRWMDIADDHFWSDMAGQLADSDEEMLVTQGNEETIEERILFQSPLGCTQVPIQMRPQNWYKDAILQRPLTLDNWRKSLKHYFMRMPFMKSKFDEAIEYISEDKLVKIFDSCLKQCMKKGSPEFFADTLWYTRRYRQEWIDLIDSEIPVTEGDEQCLEDVESITKHGNVTFVDERPVEATPAHINGDSVKNDTHAEISETPWTVKSLLEREQLIGTYDWSVGKTFAAEFGIPKLLLKENSVVMSQLRLCGFLRAGVEIRIVLNGNKFMIGRLIAHIEPARFKVDKDDKWYVAPNCPHVILDASVSNSAVLSVPFCSILTYLSQRTGTLEDDTLNTIGILYLDTLNKLQAPDGGTQQISLAVYARFVNPVIHQTVTAVEKFTFSDGFVTQGREDGVPMVNRAVQPPCFGDVNDDAVNLSLNRIVSRNADDQTSGGEDFNLHEALQIPGLTNQVIWPVSGTTGSTVLQIPVTPTFLGSMNVTPMNTGVQIMPTFMAYISRGFAYWSGDIMIKIQVVGNAFASGRLMHIYDPTWTTSSTASPDLNENSNFNCVIQDIEEQQEITLRLPYMSVRPYLRCDTFCKDTMMSGAGAAKLGQNSMGVFRTVILNSLVMPAQMPQQVTVNFFLYAAPNFSLRVPVSLQPLDVDDGFRYECPPLYPVYAKSKLTIDYANHDYIRNLWNEGSRLYNRGYLTKTPNWWESQPVQYIGENDETFAWVYKAAQVGKYVVLEIPQTYLIKKLGAFYVDVEECITQGLEDFVTNRKAPGLKEIVMTKGNRDQNAPEIEENSLNTFLYRYYPLTVLDPKETLTGFTMVAIPVNPAFVASYRDPILEKAAPIPQVHHLAWISRMYGFWSGSLKYKIVFSNTESEVFAAYVPQDCQSFQVRSGVSPQDIQYYMSYAGVISVSHLQGALEVVVPFSSPYNQCMVNVRGGHYDARCQNGTLYFFMRNKLTQQFPQHTTMSIFIAAGRDFKLNWLVKPPTIFDKVVSFKCNPDAVYNVLSTEFTRNMGDWGKIARNPNNCGIKSIPGAEMWNCDVKQKDDKTSIEKIPYLKEKEEDKDIIIAETQGLSEVITRVGAPFTFMHNVNEAARSLPEQFNTFNKNIEEAKEAIANASEQTASFAKKAEHYLDLAASTILAGNVIRSFTKVCAKPQTGNFIDLALSSAAMLGFNVRRHIVESIKMLLKQFTPVKEQAQAQAMDGALQNLIEDNETIITKCMAVLGTILYAYVFGCLPEMKKFKDLIKNFLDKEPVTQGFDLRGAHFGLLGLNALSKVFDNLVYYAKQFIDWILERDSPESLLARRATEIQERVMNLIKELDFLDNELEVLRALADPFVHNRFYKMMTEVSELTEIYMKGQMDTRVGAILTECRSRVRQLVTRLEKEKPAHGWRYDPFVVFVHGPTGTGKTAIMREISKMLAAEMDVPEFNRVYNRTINDEFWSGYTGQGIVHWDEFGQNAKKDETVAEFVELRGNDPHRLNMAALEDKGRYFTSKAIIVTTNVPYHTFPTVIRDREAYLRRRHFMMGMKHKAGHTVDDLQRSDTFDATYGHCDFYVGAYDEDNQEYGPLDKVQVFEMLQENVQRWHRKQMAMYEEYIAEKGLGVLPRGVVPILTPVNVVAEVSNHTEITETSSVGEEVLNLLEVEIPPAVTPIALAEMHDSNGRTFTVAESEKKDKGMCMVMGDDKWVSAKTEVHDACINLNRIQNQTISDPSYYRLSYDFSNVDMSTANASYIDRAAHVYIPVLNRRRAKQGLLEWGKERMHSLYMRAKELFLDLKSKIINIYEKYPKLMIVSAALGTLTAVATTYLLIRSEDPDVEEKRKEEVAVCSWEEDIAEQAYDVHMKKMQLRLIKAEQKRVACNVENQHYDGAQARRPIRLIKAEGNEDQNATDIRRVVQPNLVLVGWARGATKKTSLRGLHVCGKVLLIPFHFFNGAKEGDKFILAHRFNPIYIEFEKNKMVRLEKKDWCLYDCSARFEPRKNISKYFIKESDLGKLSQVSAMLCNVDQEGVYIIQKGVAKAVVNFRYQDGVTKEQYIQRGWATNFSTESGDCGAFVMAMTPQIPCPGKILGIHTAGYPTKSEGFAVLITREQIESALAKLEPQVMGMPIPEEVLRTEEAAINIRIAPEGDYSIYGTMPNKMSPAQPLKTDFEPTPFKEELIADIPNTKKPAFLKPFINEEGQRISPLKIALAKYGQETKPFPTRNVNKVKKFLVNMFKNKFVGTEKRIFSEKEAIIGIPGMDFAERLNMKSSPGWPYQVLNRSKPGKFHMFDEEGVILCQELRKRLDDRHIHAKQGKRVPSVWRDCLKDELRPNEKVDQGKTRLFTIAPVDYTILTRQYFMDFAINFYGNACNFFSAVGINPESYEWTKLYDYLATCGTKCVAGDYRGFDGSLMAELMDAVADIINEWYGDGPEAALVRKTLINEMIHTVQLVENCVYATHQGNPSGNPLTVIINTIVNFMYLCLVFLEIYPEATLDDFIKHVRVICYGDDVLITVMEKFAKFHFNNIKKVLEDHGLGFTTDTKNDGEAPDFVELDTVTFLKRGFRIDPDFGNQFRLPTMSKDTLYSYFHWVRKSEEKDEQLQENMRSALSFAAYHGRGFYESFHKKWEVCMRDAGLNPICITFEEQVDAFLVAANAASFVGMDRQYFDNIGEGNELCEMDSVPMDKWTLFGKFIRGVGWGIAAWYIFKFIGFMQRQGGKIRNAGVVQRTDRWAICIPSGEGKSTLARKYPKYFIDHDDLILFKGEYPALETFINLKLGEKYGIGRDSIKDLGFGEQISLAIDMRLWFFDWVRQEDVDERDRRFLLTHSPMNTNRRIAANFLLPRPTNIRNNVAGRQVLEGLENVLVMDFDDREAKCLEFVQDKEPEVFAETAFIQEIVRDVGHFTSRVGE